MLSSKCKINSLVVYWYLKYDNKVNIMIEYSVLLLYSIKCEAVRRRQQYIKLILMSIVAYSAPECNIIEKQLSWRISETWLENHFLRDLKNEILSVYSYVCSNKHGVCNDGCSTPTSTSRTSGTSRTSTSTCIRHQKHTPA